MSPGVASRPRHVYHHSAGAVVVDRGACLLVRRGREWAFPKGHIERDETPDRTAVREVAEETGVQIAIDAPLGPTRFAFKSHNGITNRKQVEWYLAHRIGGEIEHEPIFAEARFVALGEALRMLTHDADRALLERAMTILGSIDGAQARQVPAGEGGR